jgi:hypothetical protein
MQTTQEQQGKITLEDIEAFAKRHGPRRTTHILSVLGKRQHLYDALMSEVGQAMFKNTMAEADFLFYKHLDGDATAEDIMKYNILKGLVEDWARKLATYEKFKLKLTSAKESL